MDPRLAALLGFISSVRDTTDASDDGARLDTVQTAFIARELDRLRSVEFAVDYPVDKTINYLPLATDILATDEIFSWKIWDKTGTAKIVSEDTTDLPEVNVSCSTESGRMVPVGVSYSFGVFELRRAARLGLPLDQKKAMVARESIARAIGELLRTGLLASTGQSVTGLGGFLNSSVVDANPGTLHNWLAAATTAENIIDDLAMICQAPRTRTLDQYVVDTILIPDALWFAATSKRIQYSSDNAITAFMRNNSNIRAVDPWTALNGIGESSKHRLVAYAKSANVLEAVVPTQFEQLPPEQRGLKISTPCIGQCGGTIIHRPAAMQYADFATSA